MHSPREWVFVGTQWKPLDIEEKESSMSSALCGKNNVESGSANWRYTDWFQPVQTQNDPAFLELSYQRTESIVFTKLCLELWINTWHETSRCKLTRVTTAYDGLGMTGTGSLHPGTANLWDQIIPCHEGLSSAGSGACMGWSLPTGCQ